MKTLTQLFVYPIKSLGGISIQQSYATERGLQYDRQWMLVDENNKFLTQRTHPQMALLRTAINNEQLIVSHKHHAGLVFALPLKENSNYKISVQIWDDTCEAVFCEDKAHEFFSDVLKIKCKLVYMPAASKRLVDVNFAHKNETVGFADAFPYLIIGQASLNDINSKLAEQISIDRFRPNFVFNNGHAFEEDNYSHFSIGKVKFKAVKLCARCAVPNINQQTGISSVEPTQTLRSYRYINHKIMVGNNVLLAGDEGVVSVGDVLNLH